jgi:hypothetical protein
MTAPDLEFQNAITPRQFAVLLILREVSEMKTRLKDAEYHSDPTDLFRSRISVWLEQSIVELERAA